MNSEFPETKLSNFGKKFGWIFSPLLLICLIVFTLFIAEGLQLDLNSGSIERKGSIEIKDIKNSTIFLDNAEIGKTPHVFDTTSNKQVDIKVAKDGRYDWSKIVKPKPGFVKTFYPILYPKDINFAEEQLLVEDTYSNPNSNFFFYLKSINNRKILFKYSIIKQIFSSRVQNEQFIDITELISGGKSFKVLPGNTGKSVLITITNERALVLDERGAIELRNIKPTAEDTFFWSLNDTNIIHKTGEEIYSINVNQNRVLLLHRPGSLEEKVEIQFLLESTFIYKIQNPSVTDLFQNTYEGNSAQKVELPNIDNIRKDNLIKSYNLLEKENILLIQTKENIFTYNIITFELKKFNLYKNERVVFIDADNHKVLTTNEKNQNQFILTDIEQDEKKVFTITNLDDGNSLKNVIGFNGAQNLILEYNNKIELIDIDGSNRLTIEKFKNPQSVLAVREDSTVHLVIKDLNSQPSGAQPADPNNKFTLNVERFEN